MADQKPEATVDSLNADIKRAQTEREQAVSVQAAAFKRFNEKPPTDIVEMSKLVAVANPETLAVTLGKLDARIASATRARDYIAWEAGPGAAVASAKDAMRQPIQNAIAPSVKALRELGADHVEVVVTIDGDKLTTVINVVGANMPKPPAKTAKRASGSNGGARSVPLTVDGTVYASANAALLACFPDFVGKMGRAAIITKLTHAGHNVTD